MTIQEYTRLVPHSMGYDENRGTYRCSSCLRELTFTAAHEMVVISVGDTVLIGSTPISVPHRGSRGGLIMAPAVVVEHGGA